MKHVYLIRHGETNSNKDRYVPSKVEPLNERGRAQANTLADRIQHLEIDQFIASDFLRAQETMEPIVRAKGAEFEIHPAFGEMLEPSSMHSTSEEEELVLRYRELRNHNLENAEWRQEDGENFSDIFQRILDAREFLEASSHQNILVTSHSFFLMLFTAAILVDATAPTRAWYMLARKLKASNTGITMFSVENNDWKLITWNDHAHFAE